MMSDALHRYKALVDQLRGLSPVSAEAKVITIDEELQKAWMAMSDVEREEAEVYWRSSTTLKIVRPKELN
jgi:hypothetical protein